LHLQLESRKEYQGLYANLETIKFNPHDDTAIINSNMGLYTGFIEINLQNGNILKIRNNPGGED